MRLRIFMTILLLPSLYYFYSFSSGQKSGKILLYNRYADIALDALFNNFWNKSEQYFNAHYPDTGKLSGYWTFAQAFDAVLDGIERTKSKRDDKWINTLYLAQDKRGWFVEYFDDENWMVLVLIRAYDVTGDKKYLKQAQKIYSDIITNGWDTTCMHGGIWWDRKHTQKATAINAGAVISGSRLYQRTNEVQYLDFAKQVYAYWFTTMVNPTTFQVCDHFEPNGKKFWWKFTYNEGLMLGASLELYSVTGDNSYFHQSHSFAKFILDQETIETKYGKVLFDGTNEDCTGDAQQFKGIAYRYFALLYQQDTSNHEYFKFLKSNADAIWHLSRNRKTHLFAVNWAGPPMNQSSLAQHSSATMTLNIFAKLLQKQLEKSLLTSENIFKPIDLRLAE
ncbi:MAG: glycoside hydrolase family 76 protein [bacterium]|nr:glycoside hydrolase family 76 protein [bacterium]